MKGFGSSTGFMLSGSGILISNIPDLASVVLYLLIWKHFNGATVSTVPAEAPFGGIWVGEVIEEPTAPIPMIAQSADDPEHKLESVLKVLQRHLKFCLVDLAFPFLTLFGCNKFVVYFMYPIQILCFYWIPFLVIKNGFKQLDGIVHSIVIKIACKVSTNNVDPLV